MKKLMLLLLLVLIGTFVCTGCGNKVETVKTTTYVHDEGSEHHVMVDGEEVDLDE